MFYVIFSINIAALKGIRGNSIYLQDGTKVDDNDCIEYYAKEKEVFVIKNTDLKDVHHINDFEIIYQG